MSNLLFSGLDIVFSKGGFVSVPVVLAAKTCGIPAIIHESDITPGLANRIAIKGAKKVCCNFPETLKYLPSEKAVLTAQALNEGKPAAVVEKMVEGRINKFFEEICLLDQPFVKDPDKTVKEVLNEKIATIGENIVIRRFVRFERGEGLEKKQENFAEEVMKQING